MFGIEGRYVRQKGAIIDMGHNVSGSTPEQWSHLSLDFWLRSTRGLYMSFSSLLEEKP